MEKINAVITGIGGFVPEDVLTNDELCKMVDTTDEWIMTRVGIKERFYHARLSFPNDFFHHCLSYGLQECLYF